MRLALTTILAGSLPLLAATQATRTAALPGTTGSSEDCAAQSIVDDCLERMRAQLSTCDLSDWKCLCEQQGNVVTCYNNCPGSAAAGPEQGKEQSWCNAAKSLPSSSTRIASSTSATATAAKETSSSSAAASTSTSSGAAALPTAALGTVERGMMLGVLLGVLGV
ncbi:hypothetical protein BDV28DRAFT_130113 [Aspergillus coremiiformis]|uniref:GPI anchored serine-threonine rich protein n=1 Tax=Aspergillus coremiiformis TaxID=138285 RepID=A0A5N6ZB33_9EURO|nr:hypothetical protein BDV28DRAFT_130113 [Aspergillus coremiiformis]